MRLWLSALLLVIAAEGQLLPRNGDIQMERCSREGTGADTSAI